MHRDIITKTAKCNPCVKNGKNLKSIIPANKWAPLKLCKVPNEEIQIDFEGPIYNEKKLRDLLSGMYRSIFKIPNSRSI